VEIEHGQGDGYHVAVWVVETVFNDGDSKMWTLVVRWKQKFDKELLDKFYRMLASRRRPHDFLGVSFVGQQLFAGYERLQFLCMQVWPGQSSIGVAGVQVSDQEQGVGVGWYEIIFFIFIFIRARSDPSSSYGDLASPSPFAVDHTTSCDREIPIGWIGADGVASSPTSVVVDQARFVAIQECPILDG
jgi:hypothetical protein